EEGKYEDAISEFSLILASRPQYDKARLYLAMSLQEAGQPKRAIVELLKMDHSSQEFKGAVRSLLPLYIKAGMVDDGIQETGRLIEKDNRNVDLYVLLSGLYEEKGDFRKGISTLETARTFEPKNTDVLYD